MIVKDEGRVLEGFLKRIKPYVDEVIIVDTGSKDNSKEIAKKYTSEVYDFKWCDDFSRARNFSISKTKKEWILWLDPDEFVSKKDLARIKELVNDKGFLGYRFIQETIVNDRKHIQGICKLFQNKKGIRFVYQIHESVMPSIKNVGGKIGRTGIVIKHKSSYDLEKAQYYLNLIRKKAEKYPESKAVKEEDFILGIIETYKN